MVHKKKPKIAILSLRNTYRYGGVLSSLKVLYDFCSLYFEPTVFFLGFDKEISTSLRNLKFSSSYRHVNYFGMNCIEVGSRWAFWEPGHYKNTLKTWKKLLSGFHYFTATSGTCIAAHPLEMLNKKYNLLIATPYQEDRTERVKELSGIRKIIDNMAQKKMLAAEKDILQKAGYIWALSSYALKKFSEITPLDPQKLLRCGFPLNCTKIPPLNQKKDSMLVALGRFSDPRKNLPMLLRSFDKIYQEQKNSVLYIIGHKPSDITLQAYHKLPSFKHVIFTGQVSAGDLSHLLKQASLMLLTSYQEGFGIAGIEALLHGTPIISTRCGGPEDYVIDGQTGYLVNINDDEAMKEKALSIMKDKNKRVTMSYNAQKFAVENFDTPNVYNLFKQGFISMHPELHDWFTRCDAYHKKQLTGTFSYAKKDKQHECPSC